MSLFASLLGRLKLAPRDAEVIFDRDEPVGQPTDLVMPARRWFRRSEQLDQQRRRALQGNATSNVAS
jgi:hypothetical protein